jgi:ribosomal protein L11 methyltransferase
MPASYVELTIHSHPSAFEDYIGILTVEGFDGFWEDGSTLRAYIPAGRWNDARGSAITAAIHRSASLRSLAPPTIRTSPVENRNWNEAWEATIRPVRVTGKIVIAPTWHPFAAAPGDIVLTIDPKMSFGTGYHETTRLMLRLIERHVRGGDFVLDVGSGTGVLAIAALKLGAGRAIGLDNDEWAYENAKENAGLNDVTGRLEIRQGDLDAVKEQDFDLIVANIQRNVIEAMIEGFLSRLKPHGRLLLSGLLQTDREAIVARISAARLSIFDEEQENEWIALAAERTQ